MDKFNPEQRRKIMSSVKSSNTKPEIIVRKLVYSMGYRYRLYRKELPGKPDLYFSKQNAVIFIHGCFWHQHEGCKKSTFPQTNTIYWHDKLDKNKFRDNYVIKQLNEMGIKTLITWECEIDTKKNALNTELADKIRKFLS